MSTSPRLRLLTSVAALIMVFGGGAALAATGSHEHPDQRCGVTSTVDRSLEATTTDCDDNEGPADPEVRGNDAETEDTAASDAPAETDRATDCNTAAGVDPSATPETESPEPVKGLDNAIAHVLANCLKDQQAPGLVNALEHLVANRDRKAAHDAEHEAAAAERDAAKAARKAAHEADKPVKGASHDAHEHGPGGTHGNNGNHGSDH